MSTVHLIFATEFEASPLLGSLKKRSINSGLSYFEGGRFQLFLCGVGLLKAASSTRLYFEQCVKAGDRVINCGIAGAVNRNLSLHKIYTVKQVSLYDPRTFEDGSDSRFSFYKEHYPALDNGLEGELNLASSLYPIWLEEDRELLMKNAVDLVDMEAYAIAQVAQDFDVEFSMLKAVSDFTAKPSERSFLENAHLAIEKLCDKIFAEFNL